MRPTPSVTESIAAFLKVRGHTGATLSELYEIVRTSTGPVADTSIRSVLYKRLIGAKSRYRPMFERFSMGEETRYRLLGQTRDF